MTVRNRKAVSLALLLAMTAMTGLTACNTMRGVGQDVQATGSAVSNAAKETQHDMHDGNPNTP